MAHKNRNSRQQSAEVIELGLTASAKCGNRPPPIVTRSAKRAAIEPPVETITQTLEQSASAEAVSPRLRTRLTTLKSRANWWMVGIVALLTVSALGAGLKYLEQDARRQTAERERLGYLHDQRDESVVSKVNPFLDAPLPAATPQLSKEYIYAGGRMLAVEDANANPSIPADLAVWRPSSGVWYVMGAGSTIQASQGWGTSGDLAEPGDYDGDGKTDFAVYRPSTNYFYVIKSSDNSYIFQAWGSSGDLPVPADYDGDHRTDIAVYRPSDNKWYILRSSDQTLQVIPYGTAGDIPAPADYDGDGKADATVFRSSNSTFYSYLSATNTTGGNQLSGTITSNQTPVPADYDGDGKADYAMRSGNDWLIRNSSSSSTVQTVSWYSSSDTAVPNDYDGDGRADIAVWRSSSGNWYIRQSSHLGQSNELRQEQWGQSGDTPVPSLWRR